MKRELHCFDFDVLVDMDYKIRIINIDRPEKTIMCIDKHEFFLILNGSYISDNLPIKYNGKKFYICKKLFDKIQKCRRTPIEEIGLSLSNLYNNEELDNTKIKILMNNIRHLRNRRDCDIVLMLDKNNRKNYENIINKLRMTMLNENLGIYKLYFLSDKIQLRINQKIILRKAEVILEHLIGLKINGNAFVPLNQDKYENVTFYDDDEYVINALKNSLSDIFKFYYNNSKEEMQKLVENRVNKKELKVFLNVASQNEVNRFKTYEIDLMRNSYDGFKHIKGFDGF